MKIKKVEMSGYILKPRLLGFWLAQINLIAGLPDENRNKALKRIEKKQSLKEVKDGKGQIRMKFLCWNPVVVQFATDKECLKFQKAIERNMKKGIQTQVNQIPSCVLERK